MRRFTGAPAGRIRAMAQLHEALYRAGGGVVGGDDAGGADRGGEGVAGREAAADRARGVQDDSGPAVIATATTGSNRMRNVVSRVTRFLSDRPWLVVCVSITDSLQSVRG